MASQRLEVRLDPEHQRKLEELAAQRQLPVSVLVRAMIDREYDAALIERRVQAARELGQYAVEDVPDPEELSRQLATTYDIPDFY